jgi:hypothetical protein
MKHDTSAHAGHDNDNSAMHSGQRLASVPSGGGSKYTCPMHPEVISDKPGSCPKCGMTLERMTPTTQGKTIYTCPMHPEVEKDHPGQCPKCGMMLEPKTVGGADEHDHGDPIAFSQVLDWCRPGNPGAVPSDGRLHSWLNARQVDTDVGLEMVAAHAQYPCDSMVWGNVLCTRLALDPQPAAQHVHPDRNGCRRRLPL